MISWTGCGALWRTWLWWEGSEEPHHPSYHHNLPAPQLCQHTTIVVWLEWRCGEVVWRVGEKNRQRFCSTVRSVKFCDRDLAVVLPPPGGGVWVLDWLWCCGGRGCGVEGSVVVPHHPSYHNLPAPPSTPLNHVPWWWCGWCVVEVVVRWCGVLEKKCCVTKKQRGTLFEFRAFGQPKQNHHRSSATRSSNCEVL